MKIIGITGGVGSGKSRVLSFMEEEYGAVICQADRTAWELQEPGQPSYRQIAAHFGDAVLNSDGTINRKALGAIVFGDEEELAVLNQITHPAVKAAVRAQIAEEEKKGTELFVLEAALLLEDHYDEICDELWYIYADRKVRRARLKESRSYSDEKISAMFASQASEEMYRTGCQCVIDNSGAFEDTCARIKEAMDNRRDRR